MPINHTLNVAEIERALVPPIVELHVCHGGEGKEKRRGREGEKEGKRRGRGGEEEGKSVYVLVNTYSSKR